ncbi:hypothetical protein ABID82_002443 [Methylobacterium sp. PvP062]|jgi:hypothetical protein|uniref:Uncharacterized protein n=1 Tax=Methylobacterium radiotolerans TaxID=31998 RepID=A0ABV2NNH6_9HYPH|nr:MULTISPECIES: hypothetical protein [Methylobacterium]MCX7335909.1 hypothetical protein [Hyphomicrobiales bacterium]MBN6821779.1 hypothetical protein [Methylobacterium organophilum]MBP2495226.1 hypothetical protein [Methylobacterium sp. PvP105]MBP2504903.1 hypothetical protein [Methylobacterium sp. PvP109]MBY0255471.1 hypothetical protein [Methylobacterium organophilum]
MTDLLATFQEPTASAGQAEPVTERSALRAHIARILRKLPSAKAAGAAR